MPGPRGTRRARPEERRGTHGARHPVATPMATNVARSWSLGRSWGAEVRAPIPHERAGNTAGRPLPIYQTTFADRQAPQRPLG